MKIRIYIAFLYCLFGASCSFFQPESPNPERFYIKMFIFIRFLLKSLDKEDIEYLILILLI